MCNRIVQHRVASVVTRRRRAVFSIVDNHGPRENRQKKKEETPTHETCRRVESTAPIAAVDENAQSRRWSRRWPHVAVAVCRVSERADSGTGVSRGDASVGRAAASGHVDCSRQSTAIPRSDCASGRKRRQDDDDDDDDAARRDSNITTVGTIRQTQRRAALGSDAVIERSRG